MFSEEDAKHEAQMQGSHLDLKKKKIQSEQSVKTEPLCLCARVPPGTRCTEGIDTCEFSRSMLTWQERPWKLHFISLLSADTPTETWLVKGKET